MKHPTPDYYPIDPGGFPGVRGVSGFEGLGFQGSAGEVAVSGVSLLTPVLKTRSYREIGASSRATKCRPWPTKGLAGLKRVRRS